MQRSQKQEGLVYGHAFLKCCHTQGCRAFVIVAEAPDLLCFHAIEARKRSIAAADARNPSCRLAHWGAEAGWFLRTPAPSSCHFANQCSATMNMKQSNRIPGGPFEVERQELFSYSNPHHQIKKSTCLHALGAILRKLGCKRDLLVQSSSPPNPQTQVVRPK